MVKPTSPFVVVFSLALGLAASCAPPSSETPATRGNSPELNGPSAASLTASQQLLDRSMAFHDPENRWGRDPVDLNLLESRPDGSIRKSRVEVVPPETFRLTSDRNGQEVFFEVVGDSVSEARIDGRSDLTEEELETYRLTEAQIKRTRNYYLYLYGLPMKLRDPGTQVAAEPVVSDFEGREALEIRVSYDPSVGEDIWYFYFDPEDSRLIGYRFFHDEAVRDGEYILLEGLAEVGGFRLPKVRTWFTHQGRKLLGTDTIDEEAGTMAAEAEETRS